VPRDAFQVCPSHEQQASRTKQSSVSVTAGLDLSDKFGAIGATAMTKAAGLQHVPQGGSLNVFRIYE
jgi:hypothetical protein